MTMVSNLYLSNGNFKSGVNYLYEATKDTIDEYFLSSGLKSWEDQDLDNKSLIVYQGKGIALGDQIFL